MVSLYAFASHVYAATYIQCAPLPGIVNARRATHPIEVLNHPGPLLPIIKVEGVIIIHNTLCFVSTVSVPDDI